jgi:hypothetical protein
MANEAGFAKIEIEKAASTTALVIDHLREHTKSTPEMMFVLVMALMAINSRLMASERGVLRERTSGPGEASFVVTRVQLLLMRIAVQRARGEDETKIDYQLTAGLYRLRHGPIARIARRRANAIE